MIKLLVTDLAGTLLDNDYKLPDFNKEALINARKRGIKIVLATGKLIYSILPIINTVGIKSPQITSFGSTIITGDLKILDSKKIQKADYLKAVKVIKEKGYNPMVTLEDNIIYCEKEDHVMELMKKSGEKVIKIDSIETESFSKDVVSVSIITKGNDLLGSYLTTNFSDKLQIIKPAEYFICILNLGVSKGEALLSVAKLLDIKKEEIAVFGDSTNDMSMFNEAGLKIAVKNSHPDLLAKADIVADENSNNGVGKAVYEYILN